MRKIIQEGVKTRVLMLSATPVNNRLADLRNQIAFATEGDDTALLEHGIGSIDSTTRLAQKQFNRWLDLDEAERTPVAADRDAGLRLLHAARPAHHRPLAQAHREVLRHRRDRPLPRPPEADQHQGRRGPAPASFRSIRDINLEIRRLNLAAYAPLRYVLPHKQEAYDKKYSTEVKGGEGFFRQVDREESLIHLLRVNVLKRMESSVPSFALTVERQLADVEATLARIEAQAEELEEIDIEDVDIEDPAFESLLVGRKVKVLLKDVDLIRWKQDLIEDRNRLATLLAAARAGRRRARRQAGGAARGDRAQVPQPDQRRQPQGHRLHRLRRHRPLPLRAARAVGEDDSRHRQRPGHRHGQQPDDAARACARTSPRSSPPSRHARRSARRTSPARATSTC